MPGRCCKDKLPVHLSTYVLDMFNTSARWCWINRQSAFVCAGAVQIGCTCVSNARPTRQMRGKHFFYFFTHLSFAFPCDHCLGDNLESGGTGKSPFESEYQTKWKQPHHRLLWRRPWRWTVDEVRTTPGVIYLSVGFALLMGQAFSGLIMPRFYFRVTITF